MGTLFGVYLHSVHKHFTENFLVYFHQGYCPIVSSVVVMVVVVVAVAVLELVVIDVVVVVVSLLGFGVQTILATRYIEGTVKCSCCCCIE